MPRNRLNELLKQRALLEEHLAWLESEINSEQSASIESTQTELPLNPIPANRLQVSEAVHGLPAWGSTLLKLLVIRRTEPILHTSVSEQSMGIRHDDPT